MRQNIYSMKKTSLLLFGMLLFSSCLSLKVNLAMKIVGAYDDQVIISKLSNNEKEVVLIPMHHLGTVLFYKDVKLKIDSLKQKGYYFYTEEVKADKKDTITIRKAIKLTGVPFSKNNLGYKHFFDSLYKGKIKLKKELVDQPKPIELGLDSLNSRNVDVTFKEIVDYYEKKYGELKLQPCDFKKSFYERPDCKDAMISKKIKDDVILDFRNRNIVDVLVKDKRQKIAIIYGGGHFKGIREALLQQGFK